MIVDKDKDAEQEAADNREVDEILEHIKSGKEKVIPWSEAKKELAKDA